MSAGDDSLIKSRLSALPRHMQPGSRRDCRIFFACLSDPFLPIMENIDVG